MIVMNSIFKAGMSSVLTPDGAWISTGQNDDRDDIMRVFGLQIDWVFVLYVLINELIQ